MLMLKRPQSEVYVPFVPREAPEAQAPTRTPLATERAMAATRDVFRAIPWDETVDQRPVAPSPPLRLHEPMRTTRVAFASINWGGEPVVPQTSQQCDTSVRSVLASFAWSD